MSLRKMAIPFKNFLKNKDIDVLKDYLDKNPQDLTAEDIKNEKNRNKK